MSDSAVSAHLIPTDRTADRPVTRRTRSLALGALAVVVLGGATSALFALEACAESSATPVPATAPTTTTSSSGKPPATPPLPSPRPDLPPPPT